MAKYDVYKFGDKNHLVLDVQTDLLADLNTRIVVPLMPKDEAPKPAKYLNPLFKVDGNQYVMVTQFLSAVPALKLSHAIGNLNDNASEITRATDMVFQGF